MATAVDSAATLKTGAEYKASLRDGREVWYRGERIDDVTEHPLTAPAIDLVAELYDAQHDPEARDILTFLREDGERVSTALLVPRTRDELARKRAYTEYASWHTFGLFGRLPDLVGWHPVGLLAYHSIWKEQCPAYADNLLGLLRHWQDSNTHLCGVMIEPQGTKARSSKAGDDRSAVMRVVRQDASGVWIRGAKAVGTYTAQANEMVVGSISYPHLRPNEAFQCAIPSSSPGLRFICRESVSTLERSGSRFDHPISGLGEETDAFVIFDDVFVPHERLWSLEVPELCDPALYGRVGAGEQWQLLIRLAVRAEIFAGLAGLIVEALDNGSFPTVQVQVGKVLEYCQLLRAAVIAAEGRAVETPDGVLMPDGDIVAAGRAHGLSAYPEVIGSLQELCGQGIVLRLSERDFDNPQLGPKLELYLDNETMPARAKNRLMNFVWEYTGHSYAGRSQVFENVNGLPAFLLRQKLFFTFDRQPFMDRLRSRIGLADDASRA